MHLPFSHHLRLLFGTWLLGLLLLGTGCQISTQQEIALGQQAAPQFEQEFGGLVQDAELQQYVQRIGESMALDSSRPDLPWQFRVLQSDTINAFALPGGYIYVTQGLLQRLNNEAQLAAVLGHEIGHVTERHTVRQMQRAQLIQGGATLAGIFGQSGSIADIANVVGGLALMKYGRDQEQEADMVGLQNIAREGYEPSAMLNVMQILAQSTPGGGPPEFLSTHPSPENREEYLQQRINRNYGNVVSVGKTNEEEFRRYVRGP